MPIELICYKLNEVRMMLNDGEHIEEQGIILDVLLALSNPDSSLAVNCRSAYERGFKDGKRAANDEFNEFARRLTGIVAEDRGVSNG